MSVGIQFGPVDLQLVSEEIVFDISLLVVETIKNDSNLLVGRKSSLDLLENFTFALTDCPTEVKKCLIIHNINRFCGELAIMNYVIIMQLFM